MCHGWQNNIDLLSDHTIIRRRYDFFSNSGYRNTRRLALKENLQVQYASGKVSMQYCAVTRRSGETVHQIPARLEKTLPSLVDLHFLKTYYYYYFFNYALQP
jgi:hypothetical protein